MQKEDKILEGKVKQFILDNKSLFSGLGDLGRSSLVFEKVLPYSRKHNVKKTIADVLMFTEKKGIIGLEIKSEYDNLSRINRQLRGYLLNCDYLYIVCHDKHVENLEKRLDTQGYQYVGIIAYSEFKGQMVAGVYREAGNNPRKNIYYSMNILHKKEVLMILSGFGHPNRVAERELGRVSASDPTRGEGAFKGYYAESSYSSNQRKPELIHQLISMVGPKEANYLLCKMFINGRQNPERMLELKHFRPQELDR